MAMIKCPECGHVISDRAPSCPSCGAKIENEVVKCPVCGEAYFKEQAECPHCHHRTANASTMENEHPNNVVPPAPQSPSAGVADTNVPQQLSNNAYVQPTVTPVAAQQQQNVYGSSQGMQSQASQPVNNAYQGQPVQPTQQQGGYQAQPAQPTQQQSGYQAQPAQPTNGPQSQFGNPQQPQYGQVPPQTPPPGTQQPQNKNILTIALISVVALLFIGLGAYFFFGSSGNKEQQAYEYALNSNDPAVLESYLNNYRDADPMHRDKISQQLAQLKQSELDWTNTMVSGSKTALADFLSKYPNSTHKAEAERKIDSLDWLVAKKANTTEAYNLYVTEHPNGVYIDEANNSLNVAKTKNITPKEKEMLALVFRSVFRSINDRDDEGLTSNFSDFLSSFLGKSNASKSDVIAFLNKIYKDDITAMEWRANNDMKITKREIGIDEYEYSVDFSAKQKIEREDEGQETEANYRIKAKVNPDGKITELNMVKVIK
ncbi:zinc ribbon domain-containing protein [Prevotella sp. oral taxon 317]|uniref:zinc ribbon domain-containing protein n=1 Tax=Prevotella sp. oral taxon 317 TaxID=652721 RepID=UPI0001C3F43A|nr:zinc ribbon domain-containing protein [Prevotella sp. oral taxon 317]EFC69439.1 hypothetical protein HMPREF0670_00762 [Prevotella sp. oral taxon 317 str. F0108]